MPQGVEIDISKGNMVKVKGPKGELQQQINPDLEIKVEDGELTISRPTEQKRHKALHGLSRALINNMVEGVTNGFVKELELVGVGYRASNTGQLLELTIGYSHPIMFALPDEIKVETKMEKGKSPLVRLECIDKQLLGEVAAKIKGYRRPEPYKGKGIKFADEQIRRKAGKSASK